MVTRITLPTTERLFWHCQAAIGHMWPPAVSPAPPFRRFPFNAAAAAAAGRLHNLIDRYTNGWAVARNQKWSGLTFLMLEPASALFCGAVWTLASQYMFSGPLAGEAQEGFDEVTAIDPGIEGVIVEGANSWDMVYDGAIEYISPAPWDVGQASPHITAAARARILQQACPQAPLSAPPARCFAVSWYLLEHVSGL